MKVYGITSKARLGRSEASGATGFVTMWGGKDEKRQQRKRARREAKGMVNGG